jgi:hypothetical protein
MNWIGMMALGKLIEKIIYLFCAVKMTKTDDDDDSDKFNFAYYIKLQIFSIILIF